MRFISLSILAATLIVAAAPSPEPAEITITVDLTSDNDAAAGHFQAPFESPGLDTTEQHGGDGANFNGEQFNLHYNFSLLAHVKSSPKWPSKRCPRPSNDEFLVGYQPLGRFAEFGVNSSFTLCRGKLLHDNYVFTVGPPQNPVYLYLGPSESASYFQRVIVPGNGKQPDKSYIKFNNPNFWFASLGCPPRKGNRVAALSGPSGHGWLILFPFLSPLPSSVTIFADCCVSLFMKIPRILFSWKLFLV